MAKTLAVPARISGWSSIRKIRYDRGGISMLGVEGSFTAGTVGVARRLLKYSRTPRRRKIGSLNKWIRAGSRAATLPPTPEATAG
jgi:hypothetical protein